MDSSSEGVFKNGGLMVLTLVVTDIAALDEDVASMK